MKRSDRRDPGRIQEQRQRVAYEAARLIAVHGLQDYHQAKLRAARQLGLGDEAVLPRNVEVQAQLRDYQRLFQGDRQPGELRTRREGALQAMQFFEPLQPRLVGSVLDGTADGNSPVSLQAFSDDPDALARLLHEHDMPARPIGRKLRIVHDQVEEFPALAFVADGLPFEVMLLPTAMLRQAPLSPIDGRPMQRADLAAVRKLLSESS